MSCFHSIGLLGNFKPGCISLLVVIPIVAIGESKEASLKNQRKRDSVHSVTGVSDSITSISSIKVIW